MAGVTAAEVDETVQTDRQGELRTAAEDDGEKLSRWLSGARRAASFISENGDFEGETSKENIRSSLYAQVERLPESVFAVHYASRSERRIEVSTRGEVEGTTFSDIGVTWRGGFTFEDANDVAVSRVHQGPQGSRDLIAVASPVEGKDAVIVVVYDAAQVVEFEQSVDGKVTRIVDAEGTVQFANSQNATLSEYAGGANAPAVQAALDGESGVRNRGETVVAYAPVRGLYLAVVTEAPRDNVYALSSTVTERLVELVGLVVVGFLVFGFVVYRSLLRPVQRVTDDAAAVAGGSLEADIGRDGRLDEVGDLREAFGGISDFLNTVAGQAEAIADQEFDAPALQEDVPGRLGVALTRMRDDLQEFITELEQAKDNARQAQAEDLAESLQHTAEEFGDVMGRAADGDLTQRLDTDTDSEAMADIAHTTNEMLAELERTMGEVREFAATVDDSSQQVSASAQEVQNASAEVSESVQEIASGAERQNENIQQASTEMTDLSATVEEVASSSNEVASKSAEAADLGATGGEYAAAAAEEMSEIDRQARETARAIGSLDETMEEIGEVVDLIADIAEQTNILALNASIEAARAGEAGEGFGVVANEIKGLAEDVDDATTDIERRIETVQSETASAVADMQGMRDRVDEGTETVQQAVTSLETIVERVEEANDGVQSISEATDDQAASTEEVVVMVDEVGSISEETAAQAESAAAAAEEQAASLTEVTERIDSLSDRATDLRSLVDGFDIDGDGSAFEGASGTVPATDGSGDD